ncbi:hypothetical protein AB0H28_18425 [Micromonospora sp. NPDC050980]|uniref:hypothetical protein n=1 Tax=Micromonospora sp. NPDC050980 TaxID=3155161 RepID=UPI0033FE9C5B
MDDILDEAYQRLHRTGPEFEGWLSNHGPMAAEALVRHGQGARVHRWLDGYLRRLDELPRGLRPIDDWRTALGDPKRAGDWLHHFDRELRDRPWRDVLGEWWPRLLPGIAAGATHGVIRVGHAVRALSVDGETVDRRAELGQALGYWAARWQLVPGAGPLTGRSGVASALAGVPRIAERSGGIRERLGRLTNVPGWSEAVTTLRPPADPDEATDTIGEMVHRAALDYLRFGHGEPVMLVHAVTAPTAVLRTLPALDPALRAPSVAAAWSATAAVTSVYAAPTPAASTPVGGSADPDEVFARAARHGDEHVVKLADAVLESYATTGDLGVLAAPGHAGRLI